MFRPQAPSSSYREAEGSLDLGVTDEWRGRGGGCGACTESSMKFSDAKLTSDPASLSSAGASEKPRLYARQRSPPAGSPALGGEAGLWGHGIWVPELRSAERGRGA